MVNYYYTFLIIKIILKEQLYIVSLSANNEYYNESSLSSIHAEIWKHDEMKDDSFNHDIKTKKKIHYHNDYIDYLLSRLITSST